MSNTPTIWKLGAPPSRGAYRVKSDNGKNIGYRYWNGERWGCLASTRVWCLERKDAGRVRPISRPILWECKNPDYLTAEQQRDLLLEALEELLYARTDKAEELASKAIAKATGATSET